MRISDIGNQEALRWQRQLIESKRRSFGPKTEIQDYKLP
jgi:hypothetical protein